MKDSIHANKLEKMNLEQTLATRQKAKNMPTSEAKSLKQKILIF